MPGDVDTGGAIMVDNFTSGGGSNMTTIVDCAFLSNQSGWGGAVDIFHGGLDLSGCTFAGNTCTGVAFSTNGGGGALSVGPTVASAITNCTFSANSQTGAPAPLRGGGAIYNYGAVATTPPPVAIEHCTFVGNVDAAGVAGGVVGKKLRKERFAEIEKEETAVTSATQAILFAGCLWWISWIQFVIKLVYGLPLVGHSDWALAYYERTREFGFSLAETFFGLTVLASLLALVGVWMTSCRSRAKWRQRFLVWPVGPVETPTSPGERVQSRWASMVATSSSAGKKLQPSISLKALTQGRGRGLGHGR